MSLLVIHLLSFVKFYDSTTQLECRCCTSTSSTYLVAFVIRCVKSSDTLGLSCCVLCIGCVPAIGELLCEH